MVIHGKQTLFQFAKAGLRRSKHSLFILSMILKFRAAEFYNFGIRRKVSNGGMLRCQSIPHKYVKLGGELMSIDFRKFGLNGAETC